MTGERLPRTVVTDVDGIRHRVVGWWEQPSRYLIVKTACDRPVVLGGRGHERPLPCPHEGAA